MDMPGVASDAGDALEKVLGYLNFSSGARDVQFLASLDQLCEAIENERAHSREIWIHEFTSSCGRAGGSWRDWGRSRPVTGASTPTPTGTSWWRCQTGHASPSSLRARSCRADSVPDSSDSSRFRFGRRAGPGGRDGPGREVVAWRALIGPRRDIT